MNKWISHLLAVSLCAGTISCGKKIPEEIIQPDAMEDLLYDYHLASTVANDLPYAESYKKNAYLDYVFQKHHVTKAEFDSSMVWYTRNSKELATIYQNLQQRYEAFETQMKIQTTQRGGQVAVSISGDTVNIWQDRSLYWLSTSPLTNKVVFDLKADTTFKKKDALELMADFHFMPEPQPRGKVIMALNYYFDNDSVQGLTQTVTASGRQRLYIQPDSAYEIKNISGFIYYTNSKDAKGSVLLNGISLMRYHQSDREEKKEEKKENATPTTGKASSQKVTTTMKPVKAEKIESVK